MLSKIEQDQLEQELLNGGFDKELDALDIILTERSKEKNSNRKASSSLQNKYVVPINSRQFVNTPTAMLDDVDDLLRDIDVSLALVQPKTPKIAIPKQPEIFTCEYIYKENLQGAGFFAQPKFCKMLTKEIQESYSVETTITKSKDNSPQEEPIYIITFKSDDEKKSETAKEALENLFKVLQSKILDDQAGFWTKYPDCLRILQAYSDQNEHLHILCTYEPIGPFISYFNKDKLTIFPNLCITLEVLDKILQEKFKSSDISLPSISDLTKDNKSYLAQDILKVENQMRSENILLVLEQRRIRLFGLVDIVNQVIQQIEEIKKKYASDTFKLNIGPQQIQYLLNIYLDELKVLETTYQGAKIIETLTNGAFTAPTYLHDTIEQAIMKLATLSTSIQFDIEEEAFRVIAHEKCSNLIEIGRQYKCQIELQEKISNHICEIPKAATEDHVSNNLTATAIKIHKDDLAEQKVDLVVVCSTSMYLREGILNKAGASIKEEYTEAAKLSPTEPFETNSGQLKCRRLLFLPWDIDSSSAEAFYKSIRNFVMKAVQHAIKFHHTSIAFPSIGCGKFNVDKNIVANEMLVEAQKQLLAANVLLQIIFVILPDQSHVYDAFQAKLEDLKKGYVETQEKQISYKLTTLTITIISSNTDKQEECKKAINDYVKTSALVQELLSQDVLKKWTQPAINTFYKLSFNQQVILDMNITIGYLKLFGLKESVKNVELEYYKEQAKQSEQARLAAIAPDIIWTYKLDENSVEKYTPELNCRIEDAYSHKMLSFMYTIAKSDVCTIDFTTMLETCVAKQIQRQVIRHADFTFPEHWAMQLENVAQFKVPVVSTEYQEICALFKQTIVNKYTEILYIDRIQNKPWYTQYNSFKKFSPHKDTERKLFHGCPHESARLIIHSFFNRSFAGINGTVYGQGAYFSANAAYSHKYAKPNPSNGERCMFVANVLVGKTAIGNTKMKTPPPGCDSTTDGDHIFVTYRDDQAYAAYLIVYK